MTDRNSRPPNSSTNQPRIQTSVRITTRNVIRSGSSVITTTSVHSTTSVRTDASSHSVHSSSQTTTHSTMTEQELHSIQTELERMEHLENTTRRTRASFNSIRDALGNIGARLSALGNHHRRSRGDGNTASPSTNSNDEDHQNSLMQQLLERLHMVDVAHSTRVPLHVLRRRSQPTCQLSVPTVEASSNTTPVEATIFHFSVRESFASSILEPHAEETSLSPSTNRTEHRRTSLLFASRVTAHRLIMEGSGRDLLASGGDRSTDGGDYVGISSFTSSGLASFTGRGSMRDLGRETSYFDLERHVHPSFARMSALRERDSGLSEESGRCEEMKMDDKMDVDEDLSKEDDIQKQQMTETYDSKTDSPMLDAPTKKLKIEGEEEVVQPLLTRRSSKSLISHDSQHDNLSGSLYASPRKSLVGLDSTDIDTMPAVTNDNGLLYSWGWGKQSLHDDDNDRLPQAMMDTEQDEKMEDDLQVTSRLSTKSIFAVSTGQHHSACATSQGTLYVVGTNFHGCVDPDLPEEQVVSKPVLLDSLGQIRVVQVSCGFDHTAIMSSNGSVLTFGGNSHDQLGHRTNNMLNVNPGEGPVRIRPAGMVLGKGRRASAIACGTYFTMVLTTRRSLLVCGSPSIAGHRDASEFGTLKELPSLVGLPLVSMSAGDCHAAVVTAHGTALLWGSNRQGCCGREYPEELAMPVPLKVASENTAGSSSQSLPFANWELIKQSDGMTVKLADDVAIQHAACGSAHTILVTRSGRLLVFGDNGRGQLCMAASDKPVMTATPVQHPTGGRFVSAEAGNAHSILLDSSGDVFLTTHSGLKCLLQGRNVLAIAAGGDDNAIAIASSPIGTLARQFSVDSVEDGAMIIDRVENLLDEMDSDSANKVSAGHDVAKRTEELLRYPALLNSLFLNPADLDEMFTRIKRGDLEIKKAIALAIERGLNFGLQSLGNNSRLMYPEAVRCLLLYIIFFDIRHDNVPFDIRGDSIMLFCDTLLGLPFEGYRALHGWATSLYSSKLFVKMLVRPLLVSLNACLKFHVDENEVQHFQPSRRSVPVIVGVLSWLYTMAEEANLALPTDFYSDGVSEIDVNVLFEDLYRMKKAGKHERSKNFYICAHPFLLSPGCKRNLLQMESQIEQYKAIFGDIQIDSINESQHTIKVDPYFHLKVEREKLLEQTLEKIKQAEPKDVRKRLRVEFKGEEGLDAGGVTKEFFQLLSEDLFEPSSGLWTTKYGDEINWFSSDNTWDIKSYELVGILFGLALYNSVLLDVRFPLAVYRKILGLPLGLEDIMDTELKRGLQQLLDYEGNDVEDIFCLCFEVTWMELGEEKRLELKPGGADIPVTNDNKEEYVLRYVRWLLVDSIKQQWDAFEKGVMTVMESASLDLFLPEELELLVVGSPELDFDALEANTKYEGGYTKDSDVVVNFWKFVKNADKVTQIHLLKFATASSKAPIGGLGKFPFIIQRAGPDSHQLPTSHTCFNTLLLPDYGSNYDKLASLLGRAILECEGFGME